MVVVKTRNLKKDATLSQELDSGRVFEKKGISKKYKIDEGKVSENMVSVITQTTKPNVMIKSEKLDNSSKGSEDKSNRFINIYLIVLGIIALFVLVISLKTYNIVANHLQYMQMMEEFRFFG